MCHKNVAGCHCHASSKSACLAEKGALAVLGELLQLLPAYTGPFVVATAVALAAAAATAVALAAAAAATAVPSALWAAEVVVPF